LKNAGADERVAVRGETDGVGWALEGCGRFDRGRRRSIFYHRLQVTVEVTALSRAAMVALGTVFRGFLRLRGRPELRGNTGGGARRIQQKSKDEEERHGSFYSGGRVTMEP
jgi:hypothetical protein